ncbi:MAG: protein kinase domain-containing protein [Solirubrobacteraceae bacterium]
MEKRPIGASRLPTVRITGTQANPRLAARDAGPYVLGRYGLRRRLGSGAFGTVWLARDERLDRDVAVKIVPRERISEGRFEREARAAAQLSHPGIVTLYEAAIDDEGAYLVSELVRGDTLAVALEDGRLSDRDIVRIGIALCDALAHAHAHGVVHRDIKPSNVLLPDTPTSDAGLVKLTDFGVARLIGEDRLTLTGDVIGTAAYMAPEQSEGRVAGVEADLYSLALVLYEALTGVNPVATAHAAQRARRLAVHLPPLRRQRRDLPRELGQGIDLALRPRARERGTVVELACALSMSLIQVGDAPGMVASPWPKRTLPLRSRDHVPDESRWRDRGHLSSDWTRDRDHPASDAEPPEAAPADPWPARAAAAAVTAILAAWLASHVLAPSALAPAAAAVVAALAVAALPRLGWVALALLGTGILVAQGRAGGALVLLCAALLPVLLLPRSPATWPLSAAAPALGALSLACAWPAIAARAATPWRRAALAITGWVWLAVASLLANADLYARRPPATPAASAWMPSLQQTLDHVVAPLTSTGMVACALVWGAAAVVLPLLVARRPFPVAVVLVTVWSAMVVSVIATFLGVNQSRGAGMPATAVLGAIAGAIVALAPAALRTWRSSHRAVSPP